MEFQINDMVTHVQKGGSGVVKAIYRVGADARAEVVWDDREPSWPLLSSLEWQETHTITIQLPSRLAQRIMSAATFGDNAAADDRALFNIVKAELVDAGVDD